MRIAKEWLQLLDGCFLIITGYSLLDASITVASYSLAELFTMDKVGSLIVSIVAIFFWVMRGVQSHKKHKKEQQLLDLEMDIKRRYLNRKHNEDDIKELLDNDNNFIKR